MLFGKKEKKEETEAVENARVKILGSIGVKLVDG